MPDDAQNSQQDEEKPVVTVEKPERPKGRVLGEGENPDRHRKKK